uniref:Putative plant transposon protein domain-containing protein n=1 Tax=Fagus sylvatica TaxID=28930 RepID=A0A2N9FYS2_FAGSY
MAPKKSVSSEDPRKKRLKSKAQRDEPPSLDKSFASSEHSVRFHDDISRRTEFLAPVFNVILQIVGCNFEGYDPLESIRQMCGNPNIQELSRPKIADLTLESRLIHHIIAHNILPRSGSYEYTSYLDLFIMWAILNKVKLDLAFYIGWHMETCVNKKNGALPYGLQITTILNHFGVDFSGEKETRDVSQKDVYGETTMRQMRYEFKDDTWVKKNAPVMEQVGEEAQMDEAEAEAAGNEEPMQEDQEPPSAPSSSSRVNEDNFQLVLGRLDSLATSMGNIQTSIGNMQTSIDNFSTMVTKRFSTYDEHFGTLETSMEEINERLINQGI